MRGKATKPILLIDSHYLCYRSMYTLGGLSIEEKGTGVVFGFLNQVLQLAVKFEYPKFVFTWDSQRSFRRDIYPDYKRKDKPQTQEVIELLEMCKPQFMETRELLPRIGFKNNFIQTGLEADDLIAKIVMLYPNESFIIVSADNDLYQLLRPNVVMYNPKTKDIYNKADFLKEFNIAPALWPKVKAIAGCDGDNVAGLNGVGEITAAKYMAGVLKGGKVDTIEKNQVSLLKHNLPLVLLPHEKTGKITLVEDKLNFKEFEQVCLDYRFMSFLKKGAYEKWKRLLT